MAGAFLALMSGLTQEILIDADSLSERLLGDTLSLMYAGHLAKHHGRRSPA